MEKKGYDCFNCIGLCCSVYTRVGVNKRDIRRLAKYFGITVEAATKKYTKEVKGERVLKRKKSDLLGETCILHDLEKTICGEYEARPQACRKWPEHGDGGCVFYDLLEFERVQQGDHDVIPLIQLVYRV